MKSVIKLAEKIILILGIPLLILPIAFQVFPFRFYDDEYAYYKQQEDVIRGVNKTNKDIASYRYIIMGDSQGKAAVLPDELDDACYNLSLSGSSPIEQYYYLKEYLEYNNSPDCIFLINFPIHYMRAESIWFRCVYFRRLDSKVMEEIIKNADEYGGEYEKWLVDEHLVGDAYRRELLEYNIYFPTKYATAFWNGLIHSREQQNNEMYEFVDEHKGYLIYGKNDHGEGLNYNVRNGEKFQKSLLIEHYLGLICELCRENDIQLIIETTAWNEDSYALLDDEFRNGYAQLLQEMKDKYDFITINPEIECWSNDYFGDSSHYNTKGVLRYTLQLKEKYSYLFDKTEQVGRAEE